MNTSTLLSLLPNAGTYSASPSFGDSSALGRAYDYVGGASDNDSASAGQSALDFSSYSYPDDLGAFGVTGHSGASHSYNPRQGQANGQAAQTSAYPHSLVQPDFASQYRNDHAGVMDDRSNGNLINGHGETARFLDLEINQPGPSTYRHATNGLYSGSEASHEDPTQAYVDGSAHDDDLVKVENGSGDAEGEDADADNEEPLYVNAKQYHRILKRRLARARLEELNRLVRSRKPYLHESRHRHACSRPRGKGGRFLTADEIEQLKREETAKEAASANGSVSGEPSTDGSPSEAAPST
ncbi:Transcriptional activator [Vanrija albida]|uniref:Transcriptional activator HAP2 n=1 Tax=Vanrija albida TaxID=181172 RepID=A0ABR3QDS4_9TREE